VPIQVIKCTNTSFYAVILPFSISYYIGTGKTVALIISVLQRITLHNQQFQSVLLYPTRELAIHTAYLFTSIGQCFPSLRVHACVGGMNISEEILQLQQDGIQIIVGTPGRVLDMILRRVLRLDGVHLICLEAMMDLVSYGFHETIAEIVKSVPKNRQTIITSSTSLSTEVLDLTKSLLRDPVHFEIKPMYELTLWGVKQFYVSFEKEDSKWEYIYELLLMNKTIQQVIIYCNTAQKGNWLTEKLNEKGIVSSFMNSNLPEEWDRQLRWFRRGDYRCIVTDEVELAGTVDLGHVTFAVNYDFPTTIAQYLYQVGRSSQMHYSRSGVAISFVCPQDITLRQQVEQHYGTKLEIMPNDIMAQL
jgi:superfamily II DNA/RNA helicase